MPRKPFRNRRQHTVPQIIGTESELAAKLLPTLEKQGRMVVGKAIIRPYREDHFLLDFGRICGKRMRLHRKTVTETVRLAIQRTKELREHGQVAAQLTTAQRVQAADAFIKLKPFGVTFTQVVDDYLAKHPEAGMARTVGEVVEELIEIKEKANLRKSYVHAFKWKLRSFAKRFDGRLISHITVKDLDKLLAETPHWGARTIHGYVSTFKVLFYYAVKRGYSKENPCQRLELPKIQKAEAIILEPDAVRRVLEKAKGVDKDGVAYDGTTYLAIGFFTGLRPGEIDKLEWPQVDLANKTVTVLTASAKGRARRVVDLSPNLIAWLTPYQQAEGRVASVAVGRLRTMVRDAMGWEEWPFNVMRHCYASYHFAQHKNEHLTKNQLGHMSDPESRIFYNHYRALVLPQAAAEFWAIYPPAP